MKSVLRLILHNFFIQKDDLLPGKSFSENFERIRSKILNSVIILTVIIASLVIPASIFRSIAFGWNIFYTMQVGLLAFFWIFLFFLKILSYKIRLIALLLAILISITGNFFAFGFASKGILLLFIFCMISMVFVNNKFGISAYIFSILLIFATSIGLKTDIIKAKINYVQFFSSELVLIHSILAFIYVAGIILYVSGTIFNYYRSALKSIEEKQEKLEASEYFFKQMFEQSAISTQIMDTEGFTVRINPKMSELFGVEPEDICNERYNIFEDEGVIKTGIIPQLKNIYGNKNVEHWVHHYDIELGAGSTDTKVSRKEKIWIDTVGYPILDINGELQNVVLQQKEITREKEMTGSLLYRTRQLFWQIERYKKW